MTEPPLATAAPQGAVQDCAADVVHVFAVLLHALQVGEVAPAVQLDVRVCVMEPVWPVGHEAICVCAASGVQVAAADVQVEYVYVPESCPLVHVLVCDTHELPAATLDVWYAVT